MARRPKPLNDQQIRHLRRIVENPGTIMNNHREKGWSVTTVQALARRGLVTSEIYRSGLYPTDAGRELIRRLDRRAEHQANQAPLLGRWN